MPKFLNNLDLSKNELQNARIQNLASAPSTPVEGQIYHDTTVHQTFVYNGTTWVSTSTVDPATATPGTVLAGGAGAVGTAIKYAREDHVHPLGAAVSPTAETIGASAVTGTSSSVARADHVHAMPGLATSGVDGFMPGADKTKLDNATSGNTVSTLVIRDANGRAQVSDPSASLDIVNLQTLDARVNGISYKTSARVASTANIAGTFNANTFTTTAKGQLTIDGVAVALNDRVLLKDQSEGWQNGIYYVTDTGADGSTAVLTRVADADASSEVKAGMFVFISEGTANGDNGYTLTTNDPITLNTTALVFTQTSGAGQIAAGNGLTKTGNQIDVVGTAGRIVANADSIDLATVTQGAGSSFVKITIDSYGRVSGNTAVTAGDLPSHTHTGTYTSKYATSIGNGALTEFTVTHNLNSTDVIVQVKHVASTYDYVFPDIQTVDANNVKIIFATAPTSNQFRVIVIG